MSDKTEVLDLLYCFYYSAESIRAAAQRLVASLRSVGRQFVHPIVANFAQNDVREHVDLPSQVSYFHCPTEMPFSRAKFLNFSIKRFVGTPYFAISDIDLIYNSGHFRRLVQMINEATDGPVRIINYNFNLQPVFPMPYSSNRFFLSVTCKRIGGYAHGNGIIHLDSFFRVQGFDEALVGYGPEDDLFNCRIARINKLIYVPDRRLATYHLWHARSAFSDEQFRRNMDHWLQEKVRIWSAAEGDLESIMANRTLTRWGDLIG